MSGLSAIGAAKGAGKEVNHFIAFVTSGQENAERRSAMVTQRRSARLTRFAKVALAAVLFGAAALVEALPLSTNLIGNGNAEAGIGDPVGDATGLPFLAGLPSMALACCATTRPDFPS